MEYTGRNMVLLVGCPRSGTTWLQKLLASHPNIRSGEESHFFSLYVGPQLRSWNDQKTRHYNGGIGHAVGPQAYFCEEEFLAIVQNYLSALLKPIIDDLQPDELFLEKTPSHALYIPEIKKLLPDSRFIHLIRDCRDVVASLMKASRSWGASWAPSRAKAASAMWVQHVEAVKSGAKKLSHQEFCEIRYEDLWNSPCDTLKGVAEFLGISWTENAINLAIDRNKPEVMETGGTPIPVYGDVRARTGQVAKLPRGFIGKARPDAWRSDLSMYEKYEIWRNTRKIMNEAGYSWRLTDWLLD
jgi:LPS sulfotransferase NodH